MSELTDAIKISLADTVTVKFKAHGYHWNVESDDFPQYHDFFQKIYEDFDSAIDPFAEIIRKLGEYTPYKLTRFAELTNVQDTDVTSDPQIMSADLYKWVVAHIEQLKDVFDLADSAREQGAANFIAERIDMGQKWAWQLRSVLKPDADEQSEMAPQ